MEIVERQLVIFIMLLSVGLKCNRSLKDITCFEGYHCACLPLMIAMDDVDEVY